MDLVLLGYLGAILVLAAVFTVLIILIQRQRPSGGVRKSAAPRAAWVQVILPSMGQPLLWVVNGRAYAQPEQITAPEEVAGLTALLDQLRPLVEVSPLSMPALLDPVAIRGNEPQARPPEPETGLAPSPEPAAFTADQLPPLLEPAPRLTYEEELARPLWQRLRSSFRTHPSPSPITRRLDSAERALPPSMPGIEELNALVQARLADLPDAPPATIRTGSSGLIEIIVAGRLYERVEEVPDEAVRQAMRSAIRAWERQLG